MTVVFSSRYITKVKTCFAPPTYGINDIVKCLITQKYGIIKDIIFKDTKTTYMVQFITDNAIVEREEMHLLDILGTQESNEEDDISWLKDGQKITIYMPKKM